MKPLLFTILAVLFAACAHQNRGNNETSSAPKEKTENIPLKAIDVSASLASSRSNDIIQTIYSKLMKDNPKLQNIESAMGNIETEINDSTEAFKNYNANSTAYYNEAHNYLSSITDTTLRNKLQELINLSMTAYANKAAPNAALLKETEDVKSTLHDVHTALKIVVTLPSIENYQNTNLPSAKPIKAVITKANNLVTQINAVKK